MNQLTSKELMMLQDNIRMNHEYDSIRSSNRSKAKVHMIISARN